MVYNEADLSIAENYDKDIVAQELLSSSIDVKLISKLGQCTTAHSIWKRLTNLYELKGECNLSSLYNNLCRMTMGPNEEMCAYIGRMEEAATQLRELGEIISDKMICALLIGGLSSKYNGFARAWSSTSISERNLDHLIDGLVQDEAMLKQSESSKSKPSSSALVAKTRPTKKKLSPEDFKEMLAKSTCRECGEKGHWAKDCKSKKKNSKNPSAVALMAQTGGLEEGWIADSGASAHMCNNSSIMNLLEWHSTPKLITVGDSSTLKAVASGTIKFETTEADQATRTFELRDVLYIPGLAINLFSVGAAASKGACTTFTDNTCTVLHNGKLVVKGTRSSNSGLFEMKMRPALGSAMMMKEQRTLQEWHKALGHVSSSHLLKMTGLISGLKIVDKNSNFECDSCPKGKGSQASHPTSHRERASCVGEIIHADLVGKCSPSLGGNQYFLLLTDEASQYRTVFFLKTKDEVYLKLQKYIALIETESGHKIKCLWSDNGSEFLNEPVRTLLEVEHCRQVTSSPYTPQQNGAAERSNRTVIEAARTMLSGSGLGENLWAEATMAAVYILNRTTMAKNLNKTPFEVWHGRVPSVDHIHEFGTQIQVLEKPRTSTKWSAKTKEAYLVGFTARTNTYRCYIPKLDEVRIMCDVIFAPHKKGPNIQSGQNVIPEDTTIISVPAPTISTTIETATQVASESPKNNDLKAIAGPSQTPAAQVSTSNMAHESTDEPDPNADLHQTFELDEDQALPSIDLNSQGELDQGEPNRPLVITDPKPGVSASNASNQEEIDSPPQNETFFIGLDHNYGTPPQPAPSTSRMQRTINRPAILLPRSQNLRRIMEDAQYTRGQLTNLRTTKGGVSGLFGLPSMIYQEPTTYAEAVKGSESSFWKTAIEDEIDSLQDNHTWTVADLPDGKRPLTTKWVFKKKLLPNGELDKHKARLVARGFQQRPGVDFLDTYAPVARHDTIRIFFAIVTMLSLQTLQFDVTTAFLNGDLEEEIYLDPPCGVRCPKGKVLRLHKSIYGLKQSPKCWRTKFVSILADLGLHPTNADPCLFTGTFQNKWILLVAYVDDGIISCDDKQILTALLKKIGQKIKVREVVSDCFIGFEIERTEDRIKLHQNSYILKVLETFNMADCQPAPTPLSDVEKLYDQTDNDLPADSPYRELLGALNYCACVTRLDIAFAVGVLSRFCQAPLEKHWTAAKRVLKYLKGTSNYGINFKQSDKLVLNCYSDADFAGDLIHRKSTSGIFLELSGGPILYKSKLQGQLCRLLRQNILLHVLPPEN